LLSINSRAQVNLFHASSGVTSTSGPTDDQLSWRLAAEVCIPFLTLVWLTGE
jgi:hypothetical protein